MASVCVAYDFVFCLYFTSINIHFGALSEDTNTHLEKFRVSAFADKYQKLHWGCFAMEILVIKSITHFEYVYYNY